MPWPLSLRRKRPIFLCHGCFDLLHVGHLGHLLEVRRLADKVNGLIYVSITGDAFIDKGPGRPLMPEDERRQLLAALRWVDRVEIVQAYSAVPAILRFRPRWYCKGADYRDKDDRLLQAEIQAVRMHGGDILYTTEPVRHSTDYLERYRHAFRS